MLSIANLEKTFDDGTRALFGVSLDVAEGEFVVVLGPSGSGKTTLLRCLNGLVTPSAGAVVLDGQPVARDTLPRVRRRIGMIFQDFNLVGNLTALTGLGLYSNQITDISPLAGLTGLQLLSVGDNQISDIAGLSNLIALQELFISENQITDVGPLAGIPGMVKLWAYTNAIVDLSPLSGLTGLDFVDLYLIHWPVEGQRVDTWQALERLQDEGRVKSIGVSNFSPSHLQEIFESGKQRPTVNQIELSPFLQQRTIADFTRSAGIHLTAYCPLARGERFSHRSLQDIAEQTGKTPAQIMIRWGLQQGQTMIPKSVNPVRIRQNADVFDFTLSDKQMRLLAELDEGFRFCPNPLDQP